MNALTRDAVVARLKQLPSLPSAVTGLLASFSNEDVDIDYIAGQITRDQGLTARVLRVANSSFYGLQSRVGTIPDAVAVLGFRAVRSLVLAVGTSGAFRVDQCPQFPAAAYLRHGVAVGLAARALAPLSGQHAELAFTAGLLHDIGQLVLAASFGPQFTEALTYRQREDCFLHEAEQAVLGIDHTEVGALLAETWRFPIELQEAVGGHLLPANFGDDSLANLIHVAEAVIRAMGMAHTGEDLVMPVDALAWKRTEVNQAAIAKLLPKLEDDFAAACQALLV